MVPIVPIAIGIGIHRGLCALLPFWSKMHRELKDYPPGQTHHLSGKDVKEDLKKDFFHFHLPVAEIMILYNR